MLTKMANDAVMPLLAEGAEVVRVPGRKIVGERAVRS